jgi:hypothetical protein
VRSPTSFRSMPDSLPGMADSIPLDRQIVRHAAGTMSAITPESCPSWAGAGTNFNDLIDECLRASARETNLPARTVLGEHECPVNVLGRCIEEARHKLRLFSQIDGLESDVSVFTLCLPWGARHRRLLQILS